MKVFLKEDVPGVGDAMEVVEVADGYARNYLIPHDLAVPATEGRIKAATQYAESKALRTKRARERAQALAELLKGTTLSFKVKAGETGRLYGSITSGDIADALEKELDRELDRRWLELERPIREVGEHTIELKLEAGVRGHVKVVVEAEV